MKKNINKRLNWYHYYHFYCLSLSFSTMPIYQQFCF